MSIIGETVTVQSATCRFFVATAASTTNADRSLGPASDATPAEA
jgi:hypothetical protein